MSTIYASFSDPLMAERAVGALMDHGARAEDISFIASESFATQSGWLNKGGTGDQPEYTINKLEKDAKQGITTTTAADAEAGAAKGAGIGAVIGILAGLASLIIPGFGLVTGGGALATALGTAAGTAVGGAVAGGIAGYLKDQGVPEDVALDFNNEVVRGGAMIAVLAPSGDADQAMIEGVLAKYAASHVGAYQTTGSPRI
jgi:hypothetical protein